MNVNCLKLIFFFRGFILVFLDIFKKMWVFKKEYDDEGFRVIYCKIF